MFADTPDAATKAQAADALTTENGTDNTAINGADTPDGSTATVDAHETTIQEAFTFILEQIQNPVDTWAIAATLESRGMRDIDAVEKCGKADIFDLADEIYGRCRRHLGLEELVTIALRELAEEIDKPALLALCRARGMTDREAVERFGQPDLVALVNEVHQRCRARLEAARSDSAVKDVPRSWLTKAKLFIHDTLSSAHTVVYATSFLMLVVALWIYLYVAQVQAAVLGLGTVFSLLVTGGFAHAMGYFSHAFNRQHSPTLAQAACSRLIHRGQLAVFVNGVIIAIVAYLVSLLQPALPIRGVLVGLLDYFFMSILWLFLAALCVLQQRRALVQMLGAFTATLLLLLFAPHLYGLHWLGLVATNGLALWWWFHLPKLEPQAVTIDYKRIKLPRAPFVPFVSSPYFALASIYALYLLVVLLSGGVIEGVTLSLLPWVSIFGINSLAGLIPFGLMALLCLALTIYFLEAAIFGQTPPLATDSPERMGRFFKFYIRGISFAVPMAVQIVSVLVFGFGLWASLDFNEEAATTVAIGTILSFLVTGGFVQTIGRLGLYYNEQKSYLLTREVSYRLIRSSLLAVIFVGLGWYVLNLIVPLFPQRVILISLAYYFMLASLWIFLAILYTLQQRVAIVIITIIGLFVIGFILNVAEPGVYSFVNSWAPWVVETAIYWVPSSVDFVAWLLRSSIAFLNFFGFVDPYRGIPWGIYAAHWIGLGVTTIVAFVWGHRRLFESVHWLNRQTTGPIATLKLAQLPRLSIVSYAVGPYFTYGLLYFGFLFLDRIIGWSTAEEPLPLFIWFRTPYELGLDWALLSMLLTIAMLEYTVNEFGTIIVPEQERRKVIHVKAVEKSANDQANGERNEEISEEKAADRLTDRFWRRFDALQLYGAKLLRRFGRKDRSTVESNGHGNKNENETQTKRKPLSLDYKRILAHPLNPDFQVVTERQIKRHNDFFFRFYLRQLLFLTVIAIVSALVTYYGVLWFRRFDEVKAVRDFFASPVTFAVFYWSVVGYSLLVWGLLNNVFFFFLSRPTFTNRALTIALIANLLIGFILSRMVVYWYSVIGMTLGALLIAIITTVYALRLFRRLDYYYYSAY